MSYRDTAVTLAQHTPDQYVGVVFYVAVPSAGIAARWDMSKLPNAHALEDWYEEIAASPTLYSYIAAFDKTRNSLPVGESTAPPKPGEPGFDIRARWRHSPYGKAMVSGRGGAPDSEPSTVERVAKGALVVFGVIIGGLMLSTAASGEHRRAIAQMPFPPKQR